MNEQMKSKLHKLADTCKHPDNYHQGPWMDYIQFAELIVKECMEEVMTYQHHNNPTREMVPFIVEDIKLHFGVEE